MEMSRNETVKQAVRAGPGLGILSLQTPEMVLALITAGRACRRGLPLHSSLAHRHRTDKKTLASSAGIQALSI